MKVQILFNHISRATLSFWRLRVEAEEMEISQIYSPDKDCKLWARLLLRNDAHLLSFIAPGYRLAITHSLTLSQTTNFRLFQTERVCRRQFQV